MSDVDAETAVRGAVVPVPPDVTPSASVLTGSLVTADPSPDTRRRSRRPSARQGMRRRQSTLVAVDLFAALLAATVALIIRFGGLAEATGTAVKITWSLAVTLPLLWVLMVAGSRGYELRFVGDGTAEFERLFRAFLHATVLITFVSYAAKFDVSRGFILVALPLTLVLDCLGRCGLRLRLRRRRVKGESLASILAVGDPHSIRRFAELLEHDRHHGMTVVGACVPAELAEDPATERVLAASGITLFGDIDSIRVSARGCQAHTVAVLSGAMHADKLRWVSWQLEGTDTDLIVSPGLTEIAGRRLHVQPVAGLPLLYVDQPTFRGLRRFVKGMFDRSVALLAIMILAPLLLVLAALVKSTSSGPAMFLQTRVGKNGRTFRMVKFRSMTADAEGWIADLTDQNEAVGGMLFKIRMDPRVTPIGRFLRRYSLDELPQLFNVLSGSMSLVGPRPPLPIEVSKYGDDVRRRLLVKPGLTGLWQISGRSDLTWEESVRLDLRYVENWSLALDLLVLCKTARAVMRADGAY